jgi:hypothetical protein
LIFIIPELKAMEEIKMRYVSPRLI